VKERRRASATTTGVQFFFRWCNANNIWKYLVWDAKAITLLFRSS
jgi:hypothetical protein